MHTLFFSVYAAHYPSHDDSTFLINNALHNLTELASCTNLQYQGVFLFMLATYYMSPSAGQLHRIEPELHGLCVRWP